MKKIIFTVIAILLLWVGWIYARDYFRYHPRTNPHPKYFLTVTGNIDPALKNKIKMIWKVWYATQNPKCDFVANWFEGASGPRDKASKFYFNLNKTHYSFKIPLNEFMAGYCSWHVIAADYSFQYKNFLRKPNDETYIELKALILKKSSSAKQVWQCSPSSCLLTKNKLPTLPSVMHSKASHKIIIDFNQGN